MTSLLIKNGTLINAEGFAPEVKADILIDGGKVVKIASTIDDAADEVIDAAGKIVTAGLVDMHVHLREPGQEGKETIATGARAAAMGGVTTVLAMPNTTPAVDNPTVASFVMMKAKTDGVVNVATTGCLTKQREGKEMAEIAQMKAVGVSVFTDDGDDVQNLGLYRKILQHARTHDVTLMSHAENLDLKDHCHMHDGAIAAELGLAGNPPSTEAAHVAALLELIREIPTPFHFTHMSTARALALIGQAKRDGLPVSIDVTPHHLLLNEEVYRGYNTQAKVCPPMRDEENRKRIVAMVADGTVDAIATDHAPHSLVDKAVEFEHATVGLVGLETLFPLVYTKLVKEWGTITLPRLITLLTTNPAKIMRVDAGRLAEGATADIAIFDIETEYTIDKTTFASKGRNTPFDGWNVFGKTVATIVGGRVVVRGGALVV